ncbi:MAG: activator of Hsp90 ATPase 1 family protein, partial [Glaciihabitans sp.]|nr:activator of Hsp90 ATPase 1 family protein [Glaciihabitans sp.]
KAKVLEAIAERAEDLFGIRREVRSHTDLRGGLLSVVGIRQYSVTTSRLWNAITEPVQLKRWFYPVTGELRPGGAFQTVGNAGGEIRKCEREQLLRFTWGDDSSVVEIRLSADRDASTSTLELTHTVPMELAGNGTGAFYVGPGWDSVLQALADYLADVPRVEPGSRAEQVFNKQSLLAWALVVEASDTATPDEVAEAVAATLPQWAPDL